MDIITITNPTSANGRRAGLALHDMGLRAVITPDGLQLVSENVTDSSRCLGAATSLVGLPRDELGQFVAYWVLALEIANDFMDIEDEYPLES